MAEGPREGVPCGPGVGGLDLNLTKGDRKHGSRQRALQGLPASYRRHTGTKLGTHSVPSIRFYDEKKWLGRGSKAQDQKLAPFLDGQVERIQIVISGKAAW